MVNIPETPQDLTPLQRRLRGIPDDSPAAKPPLRSASPDEILRLAAPSLPEQETSSRVLRTAARLGQDRDLVAGNLEEAERIAAEKDFDPERFRNSPVLARWLSESPHHMAITKPDAEKLQDLEKLYHRRDDPLRPFTDEEFEAFAKRQGERAGKAAFAEAKVQGLSMFRDEASSIKFSTEIARQQLKTVEDFVKDKGKIGAFGVPGSFIKSLPVAGSGVEMIDSGTLFMSMKAIEDGTATEADEDRVFLFGRMHAAAAARGQSFGGRVLEGIAAIPAFGAEFAMTGGAFKAGKVGAEIALRRSLQKVLTGRARGLVRKTAGVVAGGVTQTGAQTVFSLPTDAIKRITPGVAITPDEEGKLRAAIEDPGEDVLPAVAKAFGARFVENLSERSGSPAGKLLGFLSQKTGISAVKAAVASRWFKLHPGKKASDFLAKVGEKTGWNGVVAEVFEERVGEVGRAMLGVEEYKLPTLEEFAAEVLTLAAPAVGAAGVRAAFSVNRARQNREFFSKIQKTVRESKASTLAPEALEDLIGRFAANGGSEFAYVPAEAWLSEMEKLGKNAKMEALALGANEAAYDRAIQTGTDLQLPMARFAVRVLKEDYGNAFVPLARTEPEEDTLQEAERAAEPSTPRQTPQARPEAQEAAPETIQTRPAASEALPDATPEEAALVEARARQADQVLADAGMEEALQTLFPERHREAVERAKGSSRQALVEKFTDSIRRKRLAEYREERSRVRTEVELEVNERPEYVALSVLRNGVLPSGAPAAIGGLKLSREAISEDYPGEEEVEIRNRIRMLKEQRAALELVKEPLLEEEKVATAQLKAGKKTLANRLEATMKAEARAQIKDITDTLADIKERGGIRPSTPTERIPKGYKAAEGKGVGSDELAQELADRGVIADAYSDALYDYIEDAVLIQKEVKEQDFQKDAQKIARETVASSIEALIENTKQQEALRQELESLRKEERNLKARSLGESSLPRGILGRKGEGVHPDLVAEMFGFTSGDELLMKLIDAEYRFPRETLIEELTDERMAARSQAVEADPARTHEEAVKALHNTERSKLLLADLKHLVSEEFATFKQLTRRIAGAVPRLEDITRWAETEVRKESFRTLHPGIYRRGATVAARRALDAFLRGDFTEAFEEKLQELRNNELAIAAQKLQEEAGKIPKYVRRFEKRSVRESLARAGAEKYLAPIDDILERFEFSPVSRQTVEKRTSFREWYENEVKEGRNPVVPEKLLSSAYRLNWKDMKLSDLLEIKQTVENIAHLAKLKNKLLTARERKEFDETVKALVTSIESHRTGAPKTEPLGDLTAGERTRRKVAEYWAGLRKASNIALQLDGWKEGGALWETFILPLNKAQEREQDLQIKGNARLFEIFSVYDRKERRQMRRREFIPEIQDSLSRWDRIVIALNWGNLENREALMLGYGWSQEQVEKILAPLTERDWKVVEQLWDHIDTYWPETKALSERVDGLAPAKVEALPFTITTADGKTVNLKGGYYPLKYKPDPSKPHQSIEELVDQSMRGGTWRASTNHAHRKEREGSGGRKVRLELSVLTEHVRDVIHDLTHYEWLLDANKLLRDRTLSDTIKKSVGAVAYDELLQTMNAVALNNRQALSVYDKVAEWLARRTQAVTLAFNVSTILKQYLGFFASGTKIGWKWTMRGLWSAGFGTAHTRDVEAWIAEKSVFMKNRQGSQDRDMADALKTVIAPGGEPGAIKQKIEEAEKIGFGLIGWAQWHVDRATWLGAYQRYAEELGLERAGSEAERAQIEERVVAMANQAIRDSQGSGLLADLPAVMRARGALRLFTIFRTFAVNQLNLFISKAYPAGQRPSKETIAQAAVALVSLYVIPHLLWNSAREFLVGGEDDDEDTSLTKKAVNVAGSTAKEAISSLPVVGELSSVPDLLTGEGARDYRGPSGLTLVAESLRFAGQVGQVFEEGMDQMDVPLGRSFLRSTGAPGSMQIDRIISGYLAWEEGEANLPAILLGAPRK